MSRWGSRVRRSVRRWHTVASAPPPEPSSRPSIVVEDALGRDDGFVVVTARSVRVADGAARRGLRRMLGDHALVRVVRPHDVDLRTVLTEAAVHAPVVVHVPDAPPSMLDQVTPEVRALVDARVRLVVTTRPAFLAVVEDPAAAILGPVTVHLDDPEPQEDLESGLRRLSPTAVAVVRTVADLDRLGLPGSVLDRPSILGVRGAQTDRIGSAAVARTAWSAAVERVFRPGERPYYPRPGRVSFWLGRLLEALKVALAATADHLRLRRAVASAVRAGLVEKRGRVLVPAPVVVDGTTTTTVPRALARKLRVDTEVPVAGRVARARGEEELAAHLLVRLSPDDVAPELAVFVGDYATANGHVDVALTWYTSVGRRGDDARGLRARRAAALLGSGSEQRSWLHRAGEDESDLEVQEALARRARAERSTDEAVRRFTLVARGSDDRALDAVDALATIALDGGRDDEAEPQLQRLLGSPSRRDRARLLLVLLLCRTERPDEADTVAGGAVEDDEIAVALVRQRASMRRSAGDLAGAAALLRPVVGDVDSPQELAAAAELAEVEAALGRWEAAAAVFPERAPLLLRGPRTDPLLDVEVAEYLARGYAVLGEAAWRRGERRRAATLFEEVRRRGYTSPRMSLRLGELAIERNDLREAQHHLDRAASCAEPAIAEAAARLLNDLGPALAQLAARQAAAAARAAAAMPHWA